MLWNDLCFKPLQAGLYNGTLMLYNIRSTEHDFLLDSRYVGVPDMAAGILVFTKHNLNVSVCVFDVQCMQGDSEFNILNHYTSNAKIVAIVSGLHCLKSSTL